MIPYGKQSIDDDDIAAVVKILKSEWLTTGPAIEIFENDLKKFTDNTPVICVSSGTAALHCAYKSIGIKPGDEVITPPNTFIATQAAAIHCGAKIVFCDIDARTGNIDPSRIEEKISTNTKAIVAVDYAGHPAELDEIKKICETHKLFFIEDASHSFGSKYKGKYVGSIADITTFSFFPTKNITTGEGGALAIKDARLLDKARKFARQGLVRNKEEFKLAPGGLWHQEIHDFGLNYRMPDILAALGSSQLLKLEKFKEKRQELVNKYDEAFGNNSFFITPFKSIECEPFWHLYPLQVLPKYRKRIYDKLRENNIYAQINYFPTHLQPVFEYLGPLNLPNSELFYQREISLPLFFDLKSEQIDQIIELVLSVIKI